MNELVKLLPDGAGVVAVIVVVVIFLKNQKEFNQSLKDITVDFAERISQMQKDFQLQIDRLATNHLNNEKAYQIQIQKLFDDFISISRETITAVKELEGGVRELRDEIRGNRKDDNIKGKEK